MVRVAIPRSHLPTPHLIETILKSGQLNRQEYLHLASILLSNQRATENDRRRINRIFDHILAGQVKLTD
ncbi:hypothetical protein ACKFKG_02745 [Phormidesmis sp. 146-35]